MARYTDVRKNPVDSPPTMTIGLSYNPQWEISGREDNALVSSIVKGTQLCKGGSYAGALYNGGVMQGP